MKIVKKRFSDWDGSIQNKLRHATLPGGHLGHFIHAAPDSLTIVAFSRQQIMGWVFILSANGKHTVNTFINNEFREKGLATSLIKETLKIYPTIILLQWDCITKKFFKILQKQYPKRIKVKDWWKNVDRYNRIVSSLERVSHHN